MSLAILPLKLTSDLQSLRLLHRVLLNTNKACALQAALCGEDGAELTEQCSSSWAALWVSWSCDKIFHSCLGRLLKAWARFFGSCSMNSFLKLFSLFGEKGLCGGKCTFRTWEVSEAVVLPRLLCCEWRSLNPTGYTQLSYFVRGEFFKKHLMDLEKGKSSSWQCWLYSHNMPWEAKG